MVNIKFAIEMNDPVNYVQQLNRYPMISRLQIKNEGDTLEHVKLRMTTPVEGLLHAGENHLYELHLDKLPGGYTMEIPEAKNLLLNGQTLSTITSKLTTELVTSIVQDDENIASMKRQFSVTPWNYWRSVDPHKELVASFVLPAHPLVAELANRASKLVAQWGGDISRTGYYSQDPNLVWLAAAAVYEVIAACKIPYAIAPPCHTEHDGQLIRLAHDLLKEGAEAVNCIEGSVLWCSVMECMGYNPFLILVPGHCFAGCHLVANTFKQPVITDVDEIRNLLPTQINEKKWIDGEVVVVECTQMCDTKNAGFGVAVATAIKELDQPFNYAVDIREARNAGVTPLPLRVNDDGTYAVQELKLSGEPFAKPDDLENTTPDEGAPTVYSKTDQWERRTLGVDLRNALINAGFAKKGTIALYCSDMTQLVDAVTEGSAFELLSKTVDDNPPKSFEDLNAYAESQDNDLKQLRLRAPIPAEDIFKRAKALAKTAKTALEERGSNTLYLTAGMMRWYESPAEKEKPRYAPILLYPVELIPSGTSYKLKVRDEEVMLNATLMELMKQRFKIQLPAWETLPVRENGGVDILKIMKSLRHAVADHTRWGVVKTVTVSNFDYADFALWRDIHDNHDVLANNKLVNSMMEGRITFETDDAYFEQATPDDAAVLPVRADGSQQFVMEAAMKGHTFATHGPAGTGKSECITGTIAVKMGEGEKVVLTAEKQAAINVPRSRLEAMGLGKFVLELHSASNSNKGRVLQQLEDILELAEQPVVEDRQFEGGVTKLSSVKEDLDSYARALHTPAPCGMSLYELTTAYEEVDKVDTDGFWLDPDTMPAPEAVTLQTLTQQQELLGRMTTMIKVVGNPAKHPLRQVAGTEYSQAFKQNMRDAATSYLKALETADTASKEFAQTCALPEADSYTELTSFAELAKQMVQWNSFPENWNSDAALSSITQPLQELATLRIKGQELREVLLRSWKEPFLKEDAQQLIEKYNNAVNSPAFIGNLMLSKLIRKLSPMHEGTLLPERLSEHLVRLSHYQTCMANARQKEAEHSAVLQASFGDAPYNWEQISNTIKQAERSDNRIRTLTRNGDDNFRVKHAGNQQSTEAADNMTKAWDAVAVKRDHLYETLGIRPRTNSSNWIETERMCCQAIAQQINLLKDWTAFNRLCRELDDSGMTCVVEAYRAGVEPERVNATYMKTMYQRLIAEIIDRDPTLSEFNGIVFTDKIDSLRKLDKEMIELSRKNIYNKILSNIRQVVATAKKEGTELNSLKKVIRSKGRGMTLRQIFRQHLPLIRELCPCMMFSPASMAQYLPMENDLFDLVIFDEASQIPTARAVGALARGTNAMIVGDTNQMPPTSFFTSNAVVDEDNLETEDLESVLDDCLALDIPSAYLKWHYRSRHESLIEFSNKRFYNNKLLTFPSATDRNSHVHLHMISDGVYEGGSTRRNPKEAEAIVAYIREHAAGPDSHMSIGVITFNAEQQRLVEQLLQDACREDAALAAWCDTAAEPMFVKNLENVQGDERDVILLSTNYGPDKDGKVSLNFGPLNKEGGWRRLNVAVSRAREQMEVFTSMRPEQIDLNRTRARGVQELRAFLEFAGGGQVSVDYNTVKLPNAPTGVADNLCFRLKQAGYETVRNVGCSDLRVDVAVIHPQHPDQYIMGILLDGSSYAAAKTTRDRELSQVDVLQGLGWNIRRVWTLDWYDNREKELTSLVEELQELTSGEQAS